MSRNLKGAANQTYLCTGGRSYVADASGYIEDADGRDVAHLKLNGCKMLEGDEYWAANPDEERPKTKPPALTKGEL